MKGYENPVCHCVLDWTWLKTGAVNKHAAGKAEHSWPAEPPDM